MGRMKRILALTLLELVVALAISVMLVTATAGVLQSMARKKKVVDEHLASPAWQSVLADRLRADLQGASRVRLGPDSLELFGMCGHDPGTHEPTRAPVLVAWRILRRDEKSVLIRVETPYGSLVDPVAGSHRDLMALGVERLALGTLTGMGGDGTAQLTKLGETTGSGAVGEWIAVPKAFRIVVTGTGSRTLVDELVFP